MRDYVELASSIDPDLPEMRKKAIVCDALLEDLKNLKGRDLAPYLSECTFDVADPGTRFVLKFPVGTHIIDPLIGQAKSNWVQRDKADL